jgi:hypothetical protein
MKKTNKERILASLLESSKTTADLAKELGYIDSKGTARYNIINNDLDKLVEQGYIESKREKFEKRPENTPTWYSIIYSIKNLHGMVEEYPHLIENMQRSELASETIINENFRLINSPPPGKEEYVEQIEHLKLLNKIGKESWKEKLRLSKEFFRYFLYKDFIDMMEDVIHLGLTSNEY